jgi:hypothetical protein
MSGPVTVMVTGGAGFIGSAVCRPPVGTRLYMGIKQDKQNN